MSKLSATKARTLKDAGRYTDGGGLYLNIARGGSKSWVQRVIVDGKRRDLGLGSYPTVTLARARELTLDNKRRVSEGKAPLSSRKRATSRRARAGKPTFETLAREYHEANAGTRWTHPKNVKAWIQRAERYLFPVIGDTPIDKIESVDILNILVPLQTTKPEIAVRLRVILRQVFSWAQARGLIRLNPAAAIAGGLPPRPRAGNMKALHYADVAAALDAVDASNSYMGTKLAFRFMVLTATRGAETRGAGWSEIDLDAVLWTIPADRMKMSRAHVVPLSRQALAILEDARALSGDSDYVFPSVTNPDKALSDNTFSKVARDLELGCNPHGMRSSFRDWTAEQSSASWAAVELSLAHSVGSSVERAYFRSDLIDQRRVLMQAWADFLDVSHARESQATG